MTFKIESNCDICQNHFQLLLYDTNTSLSDIANRTTDFIFLANLTNSDDSSSLSTMFTKTFVIEANEEGFYLGLRDYGKMFLFVDTIITTCSDCITVHTMPHNTSMSFEL